MPSKARVTGNLVSDSNLFVNPTTDNTGIGTTNPTSKLHVVGNALITGIVTASSFSGNASSATYATSAGIATYSTSSGVSTNVIGGIASVTQLSVSGITTLGFVTSGNIFSTGIITATSFVGSGLSLTNVRIGISSGGSNLGTAGTINFTGAGISAITVSAGIATINIPATVRTTSYTVATEGQTIFPCSYTIGYVEVYFNGVKLSPTQYSATDGANVILYEGASVNDIVETVGYNGVLKLAGGKTILTEVSADGLTFYTGKAAVGIATTEAFWTIRRSLFSSAGIVTSTGIARNIAWINRTSGIYT